MFWYYLGVALALASLYLLISKIIPAYLKWRTLKVIPGPECGFWLGRLVEIFTEDFMDPHKRWWKEVGNDAPLMRYSKQLGDTVVVVFDPDIIKDILMAPVHKDNGRFYRPTLFLPDILGYGLVTLEGKEWVHHRRLLQPAFSLSFLKESLEACVPDKVLAFLQYWVDAGKGVEIDVGSHLSALTLDVIGEAGFSYDCRGLADIERWSKLVQQEGEEANDPRLTGQLITAFNTLMTPDYVRAFMWMFGMGKLDKLVNWKTIKIRTALNKTVDEVIASAKREVESNGLAGKGGAKSLLQLLLNAKDPEVMEAKKPAMTDVELRDEMKTFLFAGHETTSSWCTWAVFALSKFPDVQEKLYQDVMKHAPKDATTKILLDQIESMEYLTAFLQEVLRLFSPVGLQMRLNRYEEKFAGYTIPNDTTFLIPTLLMHRHPKHWKDPEIFSPERWMDSSLSGMDNRGFTFLPFGAGGHGCIGYKFATYEAKLIMAHMVRALHVEIAPSQRDVEHTLAPVMLTRASPRLKVVVKPRTQE